MKRNPVPLPSWSVAPLCIPAWSEGGGFAYKFLFPNHVTNQVNRQTTQTRHAYAYAFPN